MHGAAETLAGRHAWIASRRPSLLAEQAWSVGLEPAGAFLKTFKVINRVGLLVIELRCLVESANRKLWILRDFTLPGPQI